jgi:hypothetical protein
MIAIDADTRQLLDLAADERVVWTAAPDPVRSFKWAWYPFLFHAAWVVMLALLPLVFGDDDTVAVRRIAYGFLVLYMLVVTLTLTPWSRRRDLAATRYYLTTRRFIVVRGRTRRVISHPLVLLRRLVRHEPLSDQDDESDTAKLHAEVKYVLDASDYRQFEQQLGALSP